MKLTWWGHACFHIEGEDGSLVFDPYAPGSVPGLCLPPLAADLIISSHSHRDHCCPEAVKNTRRLPGFKVERIESFHDHHCGAHRGENTVSIIETEGLRLAHLGDLGHMPEGELLEKLRALDILLLPIGGHYTIGAKEAAELVKEIKPRLTIPMHYRGEGFGYDVIGPVEDFTALFENVRYAESNELCTEGGIEEGILVLRCPVS